MKDWIIVISSEKGLLLPMSVLRENITHRLHINVRPGPFFFFLRKKTKRNGLAVKTKGLKSACFFF